MNINILDRIERYVLLAILFIVPVIVLPLFPNAFTTTKLVVLVSGVVLALIVKIIKTIVKGELELSSTKFDFPILLLTVAYIISAIVRTPNKMEAFFNPGTATIILGSVLYYFLLNTAKIEKKVVKQTLFYSGVGFSLLTLLAVSKLMEKIPQLPAFLKVSTFNPEGALVGALIFLIVLLPFAVNLIIKEGKIAKKVFYSVATAIIVLSIFTSVYNVFADKNIKLVLPDFNSSWSIAIDSLKQNPLLGMGAGNYATAFNRFKPLEYNNTPLWATKFGSSRSFVFNIMTETGLVGLAAFALIVFVAVGAIRTNFIDEKDSAVSLGLILFLLVIFPPTLTLTLLLLVLLSLNSQKRAMNLKLLLASQEADGKGALSRLPAFLITLPFIVGVILVSVFGTKAVLAEYRFNKAGNALLKNDAKASYDLLRSAIALNPYIDRYHTSFSQISFAIANNLAQKKDITDADKNTIVQLIQQSITEAKAGVTLNIQRAENWEILGRIYQSIIPFAQGSDQFAIQSLSQAVTLDPINPTLRISLGGVYYALGNFDEAIKVFELAVVAKPDYANSHYNLAAAYREKGQFQNAVDQMKLVLSLVAKDTTDYDVAAKELEALEKKLPAKTTSATESLTPPQTAPKPAQPQVTLPEEATPPATNP